jgi:hypothetical protein
MLKKVERSGGTSRGANKDTCYASLSEFRQDLRLVIDNCLTFNEEASQFAADALELAASVQGAYEAAISHMLEDNAIAPQQDRAKRARR